MQTLDQLKPGESGIIQAVGGQGALRRRLLEMGLTPGTRVMVQKMAPSGDPIEIHIRGYQLTLRKEDAAEISLDALCRRPRHIVTRRFGGRA